MAKNNINGWMVVDKPSGITSNRVLSLIKKEMRPKKVGFIGTLDPLASGVLPIAFGEATKTIFYAKDNIKNYFFKIKFGASTDSFDVDGDVLEKTSIMPTKNMILATIKDFVGEIQQVPPKYSAIKINGVRAYNLARSNKEFTMKARQVKIFNLQLINFEGDEAEFFVACSKGTYVRSLCVDIAEKLGSLAYVTMIRRGRSGVFTTKNLLVLDKLKEIVHNDAVERNLLAVDYVLDDIPVVQLNSSQKKDLCMGREIILLSDYKGLVRAYCDNEIIAICNYDDGILKPVKVFNL